jgi:hypothetical protein
VLIIYLTLTIIKNIFKIGCEFLSDENTILDRTFTLPSF